MDKDNEVELIETIQEKDRRIRILKIALFRACECIVSREEKKDNTIDLVEIYIKEAKKEMKEK